MITNSTIREHTPLPDNAEDHSKGLVFSNDNIVCAVDTETSGLDHMVNDIIQIAILPLNAYFKPLKEFNGKKVYPLNIHIKPARPENYDAKAASVTGITYREIMEIGLDPEDAATQAERWFDRLGLGVGKRIIPLGQNLKFDIPFIRDWLGGQAAYDAMFHFHYRDLMTSAIFMNDLCASTGRDHLFTRVGLSQIALRLGVANDGAHDALADCAMTAECYSKLLRIPVIL